ncbi:MAG: DUF6265 family protein [Chitinophagaceae bacterium]
MMKIISRLLICLILLSFINKQSPISKFEWLSGTWKMKLKNGGAIIENWITGNDSTISGESINFSVTGSSKVLEKLQLAFRNNEYYYISKVAGQNNNQPITFKITSYSEKGFVAENPEHDFPKRITYQLVNKDSVHAFIDDGAEETKRVQHFYYIRQLPGKN